jgi:hypothetical protein
MSFEAEWAAARSEASANVSMRLNGVDDGNGGRGLPGQKLHVDARELRSRAGKADIVRDDFMKVDDAALTETEQVAASLPGLKSASAFGVFTKRWKTQMTYVEGLLKSDVAGALRASANDFDAREKAETDKYKKSSS